MGRNQLFKKSKIPHDPMKLFEWHGLYIFKSEPPFAVRQFCLFRMEKKQFACRWFNKKTDQPEYLPLASQSLTRDNFYDVFKQEYLKKYPTKTILPFEVVLSP